MAASKLSALGAWLEQRLGLRPLYEGSAGHLVPSNAASWWYVFGSATLVCLVLQITTGICLALVYVPSADQAWDSLQYLDFEQPLGWYLRGLHFWGSNFMVALMTLHMIQVFLFGAYKYPRELTWLCGCLLFLCTLGLAFTGQVLRFDQDAYWGLGIGVSIMGRIPLVGDALTSLLIGGPIIAAETLTRFFSLHVFVLPGLVITLVILHLRMVLHNGINEYPTRGRGVDPERYDDEYAELIERTGEPFFPNAIHKDLLFSAIVMASILFCAAVFGPKLPNGPPDPTLIDTVPRPDFYFLALFSVFALLPPYMETFLIVYVMPVAVLLLFAIPFISRSGAKHPGDRPVAVAGVALVMTVVVTLAVLGLSSDWSPHMDAWKQVAVPEKLVEGRSPLELRGALVLQAKQCRNCHALDGSGGKRGPDLGDVATRLTEDQLIRQVLQGGGNMPAYGKNLSPPEVAALVAFLRTLRPPDSALAQDPVGRLGG